ncbi:MAG: hypothetical protein HW421_1984 [Ignavibacteria bacterium]|nr:hypothetical protein [Ignavibacteria bacterium]
MEELKRNYTMSNPALCVLVTNLVSFMTRDNVEFTTRGVTVAMRTALQTLGNAFEIFPSDEEYKGLVKIEVDTKTVLRDTITLKVQRISGYLEQNWGNTSGQYKRLGIAGLQKLKENDFLFRAREVVRVATEYLADLTPIGLTQAQLDALTADATSFEGKIQSVSDAKATRDAKTHERIEKGNELYGYAVTYSKVGKLIWENVNEAKYNDYIIYETSHPGLPKPQNLTAILNPVDSDITLSWDLVPEATEYDVFYSIVDLGAPSGVYNLLNTFTLPPQDIPSVSNKRNYFKLKAKNETQTSDYSDEAWVDCV